MQAAKLIADNDLLLNNGFLIPILILIIFLFFFIKKRGQN